jgi:hypothetical protein
MNMLISCANTNNEHADAAIFVGENSEIIYLSQKNFVTKPSIDTAYLVFSIISNKALNVVNSFMLYKDDELLDVQIKNLLMSQHLRNSAYELINAGDFRYSISMNLYYSELYSPLIANKVITIIDDVEHFFNVNIIFEYVEPNIENNPNWMGTIPMAHEQNMTLIRCYLKVHPFVVANVNNIYLAADNMPLVAIAFSAGHDDIKNAIVYEPDMELKANTEYSFYIGIRDSDVPYYFTSASLIFDVTINKEYNTFWYSDLDMISGNFDKGILYSPIKQI